MVVAIPERGVGVRNTSGPRARGFYAFFLAPLCDCADTGSWSAGTRGGGMSWTMEWRGVGHKAPLQARPCQRCQYALQTQHEEDAHVLAVDWGGGANTWRYWKAVANARVASAAVAKMLQEVEGLDPERVHCIGHSLGAHVCSFVAKKLGGIGRVTGLDPAQPCFRPDDKNMRLARQDARFVDVIHTNGQSLLRLGLGLPDPIGHADFYLNGGKSQPGCSSGSIFIPSTIKRTVCSHGRAYMFFTESLKEANCSFWGHLWDRKKDSVEEALSKPCTIETCSQMGLEAERYPAQGSFYVQTEEQSPFCVSRPDVDAAMTQELSKSNSAIPKT